jgi:hypothetical protein
MAKKKNEDPCAKYGIAITDYILGEQMDIPQAELFNHVANCANCRKDMLNWRNTYSAMRNEAYLKKPEVQEKYKQMLESIKRGKSADSPALMRGESSCTTAPLPENEKLIDTEWEIGHYAGELHKLLGQTGKVAVDQIIRQTEFDRILVERLIGWLAAERKICITTDNKAEYIYLKPHEQKLYRQENQPHTT